MGSLGDLYASLKCSLVLSSALMPLMADPGAGVLAVGAGNLANARGLHSPEAAQANKDVV